GSKPGACDDVVISHHRILACTQAVFARTVSNMVIAHNRIRMFDKQGGRAAIDVSSEDTLIERNDIALVPAERTPPVDPDDPDDPLDPVDSCTRLQLVYLKPLIFTKYVNAFWAIKLPLSLIFAILKPYIALGGIQVRGGSERVRILENHVLGGAGNGITLGTDNFTPTPPPVTPTFTMKESRLIGQVIGPDGKPMAGVQVTLTRQLDGAQRTFTSDAGGQFITGLPDGTYQVSEGAVGFDINKVDAQPDPQKQVVQLTVVLKASVAAPTPESAFLYDIAIERNRIEAMGLSGIGAPMPRLRLVSKIAVSSVGRAVAVLGSPVIGLAIRDNHLRANLRNPFDATMRAASVTRGLGGISLGLVDDLSITGNRIESHGRSGADPVCGVFVQYGEAVAVSRNVILDNGSVPSSVIAVIDDGMRGGIVFGLVANFGLFAQLRGALGDAGAMASAARVLGNHVEQPVGCALYARVFGPLMVNDNLFASERSAVGGLDALAGTVMIANLAGVQSAGLAVQTSASTTTKAGVAGAVTQPVGVLSKVRLQTVLSGLALRVAPLLPVGATLFNNNQVRAGAAHTSPVTQLLIGYDDVGFASNQCHTDQGANVFVNTLIVSATLRAIGNRLRERAATTNLSMLTIATRANDTSLNQGDHCIVSQDTDPTPPNTVQYGNQVMLPDKQCASFNMMTALLFKPLVTNQT
ncbi:MAG: hypothetical protein JWQ59_2476, partial [Cryobacterium sp.]|nr:hypothetical protein [Cryobacterium sp.]